MGSFFIVSIGNVATPSLEGGRGEGSHPGDHEAGGGRTGYGSGTEYMDPKPIFGHKMLIRARQHRIKT